MLGHDCLKIFDFQILGVIAVALVGHYITENEAPKTTYYPHHYLFVPELFFLLIATTCLIASALLLVSCIMSIATATILPKTVFVSKSSRIWH